LGNDNAAKISINQSNQEQFVIPKNQLENRQELKARMARTQFSFGTSNEQPKTQYTSSIDAQAQKGGKAANGREVRS